MRHVTRDQGNARLALNNLAVDGVSSSVLHAVRLQGTLVDECLARGAHDTYKHLEEISIIVIID